MLKMEEAETQLQGFPCNSQIQLKPKFKHCDSMQMKTEHVLVNI